MCNVEVLKNTFFSKNGIDEDGNIDDERLENFEQKIGNWLENVKSDEEKQVFIQLFTNFNYFTRMKFSSGLKDGYSKFKGIVGEEYKDSLFLPLGSQGGIFNGAYEIMPLFRRINRIDKTRIVMQTQDFLTKRDISSVKNIVLVDDFIGSGTTLKKYIELLKKDYMSFLENKCIYVIVVVVGKKGLESIGKLREETGLDIKEIIYHKRMEKAFTDLSGIFSNEKDRAYAKKIIKKYEQNVAERPIDIMGFKKSEGLIGFYYNTPNNTLAVFWDSKEESTWVPILPREKFENELPENKENVPMGLDEVRNSSENKKHTQERIKEER